MEQDCLTTKSFQSKTLSQQSARRGGYCPTRGVVLDDRTLHGTILHDTILHDRSLRDRTLHDDDGTFHDGSLHDRILHDTILHDRVVVEQDCLTTKSFQSKTLSRQSPLKAKLSHDKVLTRTSCLTTKRSQLSLKHTCRGGTVPAEGAVLVTDFACQVLGEAGEGAESGGRVN